MNLLLFLFCLPLYFAALPPIPIASPPGDILTQPVSVTLSAQGSTRIYFSLNGENPSDTVTTDYTLCKGYPSCLYTTAILIEKDTVLKAISWPDPRGYPSTVSVFHFQFNLLPAGAARKITNSIGMNFMLMPPGADKAFYMGQFEVTQGQYQTVMGKNPASFKDNLKPVEQVNYFEAQEFVRKLNLLENTNLYRLPTLSEWFHAARSGSTARYFFGEERGQLSDYAWVHQQFNPPLSTHTVGYGPGSAWGLYEMVGNVREWTAENINGAYLACNCGYNDTHPRACESHTCVPLSPQYLNNNLGFRIVRDL